MNTSAPIDVFLSRKSEDAPLARQLYDFLTAKGLKVFDSAYSLPELGNADYQRAIDHALETCTHMIVVGSSVENICSSWVDAEWRLFISEKRAGYKPGNILSVVTPGFTIRSLPASLRYYEVIVLEEKNLERIFAYVKRTETVVVPVEVSKLSKNQRSKPFQSKSNHEKITINTKPIENLNKMFSFIQEEPKLNTIDSVDDKVSTTAKYRKKSIKNKPNNDSIKEFGSNDKTLESIEIGKDYKENTDQKSHDKKVSNEYWDDLPESWKKVFRRILNISTPPTNEQLNELFKLEKIVCSNSLVDTLLPIASFSDLNYLSCSYTNIKSIKPLLNLSKLTYLNIKGLNIKTQDLKEFININPKCRIEL